MAKQTRAKRKASGTAKKPARPVDVTTAAPQDVTPVQTLPRLRPAWRIGWDVLRMLWQYRLFFLLLVVVYLGLDLLLVRSVAAFDVATLKAGLSSSLAHGSGAAVGGLSVFSSLFSAAASGASADATGAYHFFLVLLMSLVVIWSLRQIFTAASLQTSLSIRSAFYESTTQLVPFLLIVLLMGLQFLPLLIVLQLYNFIVGGGIANSAGQQIIFLVVLLATMAVTLVWMTRTVMTLYIVTLSGMRPMQAYRSAKDLVRGRRLSLMRKLLFLPLALFVLAAIIMVPCIIIWAPLAQWLFFVLTGFGFVLMHAYLYMVYRELLHE